MCSWPWYNPPPPPHPIPHPTTFDIFTNAAPDAKFGPIPMLNTLNPK